MYAGVASASSARFLVNLLIVASPVLLLLALDRFLETGFDELILSLEAIAVSAAIAILYLRVRTA